MFWYSAMRIAALTFGSTLDGRRAWSERCWGRKGVLGGGPSSSRSVGSSPYPVFKPNEEIYSEMTEGSNVYACYMSAFLTSERDVRPVLAV